MVKRYEVACIQCIPKVVKEASNKWEVINQNLDRIIELIEFTVTRFGKIKLAVLPEYGIMGTYRPRSVAQWLEVAVPVPGPATDRLAEVAHRNDCYIAANLMEADPEWPGRFFNTSFIISPAKEVILKYRKHNGPNNMAVSYTGPGDVFTEYVNKYGLKGLFPVVDTPIGKLACMTCYDIVFPEVARCLALNGAEVIIHPTSEPYMAVDPIWQMQKQTRAYENLAYLVSTNVGGFLGTHRPEFFSHGQSVVVGYDGRIIAETRGPGESVIRGMIDLEALRDDRTQIQANILNPLYQLRAQMYGAVYTQAHAFPNDYWAGKPIENPAEATSLGRRILNDLLQAGLIVPPTNKED